MVSFLDFAATDSISRRLRIDPQDIRKARTAYLKKSLGADAAMSCLPESVREAFRTAVHFGSLRDVRRFDSLVDGASKLVFRTPAGFAIETVILRPNTGRTALCVSSQVGCAAACAFCATGHMGMAHDLSCDEILDQVVSANELLRIEGRRVRNLVFMGMGEPLHNAANLQAALGRLEDPACFDHAPSRTLVSTVGVPEPWLQTATLFPRINYALSLHAAIQETREQIIPLARRYTLCELREAVVELNRLQPSKTSVMVEYLMLDGLNDSDEAKGALIEWLTGLRVHINLIPFNPIEQAPTLRATPRPRIERFAGDLKERGFATTIRYSLGRDIDAACGQLVIQENREIARALSSDRR